MKKKKNWWLIFVALLIVALVGCGGKSEKKDSESEGNKIIAWAWDESFNIKALEEAKKMYDGAAEIEIVTMSQDDIVQKLNTGLASGNKEGLPDIVLIEDYRIQGYLTSYPDAFEELNDIVEENKFDAYKFAVNKVGDKIYGVPFDSGVGGVFYRLDYLEEAGYSETDMENITWADFLKIGKAVKEKTGHPLLSVNPSDLGLVRMIMQSSGKWYVAEDGTSITVADNEPLKEGIRIFVELLKSGLAIQVSDWDGGVNAVQSGEVTSAVMGAWYSSTIKGAEDQSGKWKIAPTPKLKNIPNSVNATNLGGGGWYVLKDTGNTEGAKEFLKETFASSVGLMDTLAKDIGLISTLKEVKNTEEYQKPVEFYGGQKVFEDFSIWSGEIPSVNYGLHTYAIESILTEYVQQIMNGMDIDKALSEAQKQIESSVAN